VTERVLITAALLYANGPLHPGHLAGCYLAADCYARFQRLIGNDVFFVSGSDEYGVAITLSAEKAGRSPREHVDHFHELNKQLFEKLDISFDHYSRTTWPGHREPVEAFFRDLLANGYVEPRETEQLYSEQEGRFLADRYVTGTCPHCKHPEARGDECPSCGRSFEATDLIEPRSKMTGAPLTLRRTRHWFLLLDKLKKPLQEWLAPRPWKESVLNFARHYLEDLKPRAITRDGNWGVPVPLPEAEGKVFYVWFDAPIGYLSASQEGIPQRWRDFWCDPKTRLVHFIGKDNIFFHALFFPAMIMGQNEPYILCHDLPANEFLHLAGAQFSKSEGRTIDLGDFLERYSADQLRYALAANAPETGDSDFTWEDFTARCNGELVGKLGNLVNRTLVFAQLKCKGAVPPEHKLETSDKAFLDEVESHLNRIRQAYSEFKLRQVTQLIMELAALGNGYFDHQTPWKAEPPRMETTIRCCLQALQALALSLLPLLPSSSHKLYGLLNLSPPEGWEMQPLAPSLPPPSLLFEKIEDPSPL